MPFSLLIVIVILISSASFSLVTQTGSLPRDKVTNKVSKVNGKLATSLRRAMLNR